MHTEHSILSVESNTRIGYGESIGDPWSANNKHRSWVGKRGTSIFNKLKRPSVVSTSNKQNTEDFISNFHNAVQTVAHDDIEFKKIQRTLKQTKFSTHQGTKIFLTKYFEGNDDGKYVV